ncbi:MAG TPA: DUF2491 family protein, partial [Pseudomonadales bacterium]|nr:DUF2491 family protein [Pseudomonadales bacterium]
LSEGAMWKKIFGSAESAAVTRWPFDLRKGAMVQFDQFTFSMLPEDSLFTQIPLSQPVETRGYVDLGANVRLHRFYLSDDVWIQAKAVNSDDDSAVDDLKVFMFYDTKTPTTQAGLEALAGANSPLGRSTYQYEGKTFDRVWGDGEDRAELVEFTEDVYAGDDSICEFSTVHRAMLYERQIAGSEKMEYLLISVEETGEDVCVVFSIGLDLSSADFSVT